jgi:hypothetical protein
MALLIPWTAAELDTILAAPGRSAFALARELPGRSPRAIFRVQVAAHDLHMRYATDPLMRRLREHLAARPDGFVCPLCHARL